MLNYLKTVTASNTFKDKLCEVRISIIRAKEPNDSQIHKNVSSKRYIYKSQIKS